MPAVGGGRLSRGGDGVRTGHDALERERFLNAFVAAAKTGELTRLEQLLTSDLAPSLPLALAA
jgi:hypothetical protein